MIDNFAIGLTHLLMALAAWRLLSRKDLDSESSGDSPSESASPKQGVRHV
jgi:hypothetical protein